MSQLEDKTAALFEDETLRSNMDSEDAAIWFHAACDYMRKVARRGGDLDVAYRVAERALGHVNWLIDECAQAAALVEAK